MTGKPYRKAPVFLSRLLIVYLLVLVALTVLSRSGTDRWWFGALNLYLPQALWAIPGILLAVCTLKMAWKLTWLPVLCVFWVAGPLMGFKWPLYQAQESAGGIPLRVMTWNVKYGGHNDLAHLALRYDIEWNNPTVVFLQEAGGALQGTLADYFRDWNVRSCGEYLVASRLPLGELQVRQLSPAGSRCVRSQLQVGPTAVTLYDIHLESPRDGLGAMSEARENPWHLPKAAQQLENNMAKRLIEVRTLQEYLRQEKGPVIIAGDLNSPDASLVGATLRAVDLHDAFDTAGKGYGYTYGHFLLRHRVPALNFSWMRIDHIMMSPQFKSRRCWTGIGEASEHRPVIADLVLRRN